MKKLLLLFLLLGITACNGQAAPLHQQHPISKEKIGNAISCLRIKLKSIGVEPPHANANSYLVHYFYGVITPGDEDENELQLIVYGPREASAMLYQVYFEGSAGQEEIYIGEWGTLKKQNKKMIPNEIPGGVASYYEVKKLLKIIAVEPVITIPDSDVKTGKTKCVYQP